MHFEAFRGLPVMDRGGWLRVGLERYEAAFREDAIDFS
jgi:hypothetical protein